MVDEPVMVRHNLEQQMATAATKDNFEDKEEPIPPATPPMYHHDSEDNIEEFATIAQTNRK